MSDTIPRVPLLRRVCRFIQVLSCLAIVWLAQGMTAAADEAAGPELPVREGLEFWFDAAAIPAEQPAPAGEEQSEGVEVAVWPDKSSHQRDAKQSAPAARPHLVFIGDRPVVRFDGEDDHMRVVGLDGQSESVTVFLMAAPAANPGAFLGLLASNVPDRRDYESGFTIDLGPGATAAFGQINVEGRGFGTAQNLLASTFPFGTLHVVEAAIRASDRTVRLTVDGKPQRDRPYTPGPIALNELTLGARFYTNGPGPQQVRGSVAADIAEVLVYGRELSAEEAEGVHGYLQKKHASLREAMPGITAVAGAKPLESIADPPAIQMFVPGFEVRPLPLKLPNVNNVRSRPDGKLVALAYDGDVYLLSDGDEDGLEETAEVFWKNPGRVRSPIGMALTPPGYEHGAGLFMATKSECLLVVDTDGDDQADREILVATGWSQSFHNVDALGVAVDPRDGSVFFGLGTANFADPFLRDKEGRSAYRLNEERATILKVSPDFSSREVFCTGIRFPVALAFNEAGDLFCTDQEGATWVPNGNPLDELLHIQPGRHYGFPPAHPRLLPEVVDEPSTYDYGPQHQSTCGLTFNEPVSDGPAFGPEFWRGDALVCGYSRGKLYRTKLAKSETGYVADNRLIACLNMLTVDSCITLDGDLVVATHSGGPDWGSGPAGEGKLYKVRYQDRDVPQPVATWVSARDEVRISFDRPLDPQALRRLAEGTEITYGPHVRAGDEFESLRPGYEVVGKQMSSIRRDLRVFSAQVTADRRTLLLSTEPHSAGVWYAIRLPGLGRPTPEDAVREGALPQLPRIDLDYTLGGVEATWEGNGESWSGWLPHPDLDVCRSLLPGSAEHEALWPLLEGAGVLRLRTQLDLTHMLRARVQPGSELDYELPPEDVSLTFAASVPFQLKSPDGAVSAEKRPEGYAATIRRTTTTESAPVPVELVLESPGNDIELTVSWRTADDDLDRPLPLVRLLLPWAKPVNDESSEEPAERIIPELAGGSWARGRSLFFGETAGCFKCHAVHDEGGASGPNLSNLVHRDYASVLRDVTRPSYAINPDYIPYVIALDDGRVLTGTLRGDGDRLEVTDTNAQVTIVERESIEEMVPTAVSIMPDRLVEKLGPDAMRDLLTFLLATPPHMPLEGAAGAPAPRSLEELRTLLAGAPEPPLPTRPIRLVLVAGPKDHGPGEHDYPAWQEAWAELLSAAAQTDVGTAWEWPSKDQFQSADVLVFYQKGDWTPDRARDVDAFLERGGGLVYIHYAVDGGRDAPGFAQRIGLAWQGGRSAFRHGPLELDFTPAADHPVARNLSNVKFVDESYWNLVGDPARIRLMASAVEDNQPRPLFWTLEPSKGRVFVSIPGHYSWTFDDPVFRVLLLRGIAWAAREPVDRFNSLAAPGARLGE